jgi:hypothetical protein
MAATINGKRRRSESARLPSPSSLWPYLSTRLSSCTPLCTRSTPLPALEPNSTGASPRVLAAAVVISSPPVKDWFLRPFFMVFWDRRGLIKHVLLQVHVLDASRSSFTVRRSAAGIAVDAGPLLRFSFRSRRRCWFCTPR